MEILTDKEIMESMGYNYEGELFIGPDLEAEDLRKIAQAQVDKMKEAGWVQLGENQGVAFVGKELPIITSDWGEAFSLQ